MTEVIRDFIVFLFALFVMFCIWVITGGPERYVSHVGPFIKAPAPLDSGEPYSLRFGESAPPSSGSNSSYYPSSNVQVGSGYSYIGTDYNLSISASALRGATTANQEYFTITNVSGEPQQISGLTVANQSKKLATIGGGTELVYAGRANPTNGITLAPGAHAHIITGRSPVGVSFRTNSCTGYLGQFQQFTPKMASECPYPEAELPAVLQGTQCEAFAKATPRCTLVIDATRIPQDQAGACKAFFDSKIGYNSCVESHRQEADFFKDEWYIYLGKDTTIWNTGGAVNLLTSGGKVVGVAPF